MKTATKKNLAALFVSLVAAFIIVEVIARLLVSDPWSNVVVPNSIKKYDPNLGWSLKPRSEGVSDVTGRTVTYRINANGFRGKEVDIPKPDGVVRIILIGDSNTFGFGVPIERHFSTLLEGYYDNLEVINLGVAGYGIDQELLMLQREGLKYYPDIVIAYVPHFGYFRHMRKEYANGKPKPWFDLEDDELVLRGVPVPTPMHWDANPVVKLRRYITKHSRFAFLVRTAALDLLGVSRDKTGKPTEIDREITFDSKFLLRSKALAEKIIKQMQTEIEKNNATFIFVTWMDDIYNFTVQEKILSLNVRRALRNEMFKLPNNYLHINESGNGVLAREIQKYIDLKLAQKYDLQLSDTDYEGFN